MGLLIYMDGDLVPQEEAKVSVFDHGLLYGDGVFEGIRAYNGRVFRLEQHVDRLIASSQYIALDLPMSKAELIEATLETLRANNLSDAYIRVVVTRGCGDLGLDPRKCQGPTVIIIADKITLYPARYYEEGLELVTLATVRNIPMALNPGAKSLNYLNSVLGKIECTRAGVQEGIMLNREGFVAECTGDNIFVIKQDAIITPPISAGILEGVTRGAVIELACELGYDVRQELFTLLQVYTADECFLTGTAAEVIPAVKVDGRVLGSGRPGPITLRLTQEFRKLTTREGTPIYAEKAAVKGS